MIFRVSSTANSLLPIFLPYLCSLADITSQVSGASSEQRTHFCGNFFFVFNQEKCGVFLFSVLFSDEVSSFRNKILTNQKPELGIRNCQWNCMNNKSQVWHHRSISIKYCIFQKHLLVIVSSQRIWSILFNIHLLFYMQLALRWQIA